MNLVALILILPAVTIRDAGNTQMFEFRRVEVPSGLPGVNAFSCLVPASWASRGSRWSSSAEMPITPAVGRFSFSSRASKITGEFVIPFVAGLDAQPKPADYALLPTRIGKPGEATTFGFEAGSPTKNLPPLDLPRVFKRSMEKRPS